MNETLLYIIIYLVGALFAFVTCVAYEVKTMHKGDEMTFYDLEGALVCAFFSWFGFLAALRTMFKFKVIYRKKY